MKKLLLPLMLLFVIGCQYLGPQPQQNVPPTKPNLSAGPQPTIKNVDIIKSNTGALPAAVRVCIDYIEKGTTITDSGSGFFVEKNNKLYLVTAKHCLQNLHRGTIYIQHGEEVVQLKTHNKNVIVSTAKQCDYAFIPIISVGKEPHILKVGSIAPGDSLSIVGYPGQVSKEGDIEFNLVIEKGVAETIKIETNAIAQVGHSGGAVLNSDGEVVGILSTISQDAETGKPVGSTVVSIEGVYKELK